MVPEHVCRKRDSGSENSCSIAKAQHVGGYQGAVTPISFKGKGRNSMVYMKQRESPTCGHLVTVTLEWGPEDEPNGRELSGARAWTGTSSSTCANGFSPEKLI